MLVGAGTGVRVAVGRGRRVRVEGRGVKEARTVGVPEGSGVGLREAVAVRPAVGVGTNAMTACSVSAAEVLRLATAKSTMFTGSSVL